MPEAEDTPSGAEAPPEHEAAPPDSPPPSLVTPRLVGQAEADQSRKFRVAFIGLGLILVAALVGLVVVLVQPDSTDASAGWSDWRPADGSDVDRAQAVADFVSVNYRLADGKQLVTVQADAPEVQSIPVDFIEIRSAPDGTIYPDPQIPVFRDVNAKGVQYLLCGLGEACAIPTGIPSAERLRLLRREALELALYTFRYIGGKDYVVVFMPPKPGERPTYALFFDRHDFGQELGVPLRQTLPDPLALSATDISPIETDVIDRLTDPRFFAFSYSQLQDQRVVLVLNDPHGVKPQPVQTSSTGSTTTTATDTTATTTTPAATTPTATASTTAAPGS